MLPHEAGVSPEFSCKFLKSRKKGLTLIVIAYQSRNLIVQKLADRYPTRPVDQSAAKCWLNMSRCS